MNTKEQKFADEYVFLYFNSNETIIGVEAARTAGYDIPKDVVKADDFTEELLEKPAIKTYINEQIEEIKEKLSPEQRRNLWNAINAMELGETTDWSQWGAIDYR